MASEYKKGKLPKGHNFSGRLLLGRWVYCKKCLMVKLNNRASQKKAQQSCKGDKYDDYELD